jgi:hypothetical protein
MSDKLLSYLKRLPMDVIEQYKSYLQDLGNIGVRQENSRRFYLAVPSALVAFLALAGKDGPLKVVGPVQDLVAVVGILICAVWLVHMQSFQAVYRAKFTVLRSMEEQCNLFPIFVAEWKELKDDPRYKWLRWIDRIIPVIFGAMFLVLLFLK